MDIDPFATSTDAPNESSAPARHARLNSAVAITIALLATFVGICKVKDDNIVQAMQQAQADKVDQWNFYQARNIREEIAKATVTELQLASASAQPAEAQSYQQAIARYQALVDEQAKKKAEVEQQAKQDADTYDSLNYRDDQFDLSDALTALAISLLALTSLTHKRGLFWVALGATALGVLMGLAGLAGWHIHPDSIAQLLS